MAIVLYCHLDNIVFQSIDTWCLSTYLGRLYYCQQHFVLFRARFRELGTVPIPQTLLKLFKLANPKPAYPKSPIPSLSNSNKALTHSFPLTLCFLTNPSVSHVPPPHPWHGMLPYVGMCRYNKVSSFYRLMFYFIFYLF